MKENLKVLANGVESLDAKAIEAITTKSGELN